jgi:hypothetical protein
LKTSQRVYAGSFWTEIVYEAGRIKGNMKAREIIKIKGEKIMEYVPGNPARRVS